MLRRVLSLASAVSFLFAFAAASAWVWSYRTGCALEHGGPTQLDLTSEHGSFAVIISHPAEVGEPWSPGWSVQTDSTLLADEDSPSVGELYRYRRFGFECASYVPGSNVISSARDPMPVAAMRYQVLAVPHWFLIAVLLMLPVAWIRRRGRRHARAGVCIRCGYDLTGNASGICPECGTPISATATDAVTSRRYCPSLDRSK